MTLAQKRIVHEFEANRFPALKSGVEEAAGWPVPLEVNWDSLAVANEESNYAESWPKIYFEPLTAALRDVGHDEMGREALKTSLKKIVVQNVKGCDYGTCWASFHDGVLTLDHQSVVNAFDVEGRRKGLVAVLEQSL
ncbi:MAG: hypothetical protein ABSF22_22510 [Bryobacteraceae bacterium]